jgi:hypothetical protein
MYPLYKVIISVKTIDISGFKMIYYDTAGGSCDRHQLYSTSEALQLTLSDLPSLVLCPQFRKVRLELFDLSSFIQPDGSCDPRAKESSSSGITSPSLIHLQYSKVP